jgi:IK cytokine
VPVVFKRDAKLDEELRKPKVTDVREKDPSYVGDSYAECYPGTYETSFLDNEASDDEDDIAKMDLGKKGKLHRWDFESEEAWSSYNDSREAMPKAAFQFGVKMSGGRKTKKHAPKQELKKFDKDLKKIQSVSV